MQWKNVPGFPDYEVSEYGNVRRGIKVLKPERTHGNDRKRFRLCRGGRVFAFKASQLVALAFIGPAPFKGAEVCHNDGFKHNDHFTNLRWDTHYGNALDTTKHRLVGKEIGFSDQLRIQANELLARGLRGAALRS